MKPADLELTVVVLCLNEKDSQGTCFEKLFCRLALGAQYRVLAQKPIASHA